MQIARKYKTSRAIILRLALDGIVLSLHSPGGSVWLEWHGPVMRNARSGMRISSSGSADEGGTVSIDRTRRLLTLMCSSISLTGLTAASQPVVLKPTYKVRIERAVMIPMR